MSLPLNRAVEITSRATIVLTEFTYELAKGANEQRVREIERDSKLIKLIVKAALWPYRKELRPYFEGNEELMEEFGLD